MTVIALSGSGVLIATTNAAGAAEGCAGRVYVANFNDGTASVIETATGEVSDTITVGKKPIGVAICPERNARKRPWRPSRPQHRRPAVITPTAR